MSGNITWDAADEPTPEGEPCGDTLQDIARIAERALKPDDPMTDRQAISEIVGELEGAAAPVFGRNASDQAS